MMRRVHCFKVTAGNTTLIYDIYGVIAYKICHYCFVFLIEMYVSCRAAVRIDAKLGILYKDYIRFISVDS